MFSNFDLLERLIYVGLGDLPGDKLPELASNLEDRADETGLAAPQLAAESIWEISSFFDEYNERGGIQPEFLAELDQILQPSLKSIQTGDPLSATKTARSMLRSVRRLLVQVRQQQN